MHFGAKRLLYILACVPALMLGMFASALFTPAVVAAPLVATVQPQAPSPYVIAIDAGHGGSPDNANPDQPFDPGVIGINGAVEKDLTLDVSQRLRSLLEAEGVKVIMTRTDDTFVGISTRMQTAIDAHADLFVSVHFNSFTDPSTSGALVLYPNDASLNFAQTMDKAVASKLSSWGIADDGVQSKPELWQSAAMPTATVEAAYLTNPRDAGLATQATFRQAIANAISAGISLQIPTIAQRQAQITAWNNTHANSAALASLHTTEIHPGIAFTTWMLWFLALALAVKFRRPLWTCIQALMAFGHMVFELINTHRQPRYSRRHAVRSRPSSARARSTGSLSRDRVYARSPAFGRRHTRVPIPISVNRMEKSYTGRAPRRQALLERSRSIPLLQSSTSRQG